MTSALLLPVFDKIARETDSLLMLMIRSLNSQKKSKNYYTRISIRFHVYVPIVYDPILEKDQPHWLATSWKATTLIKDDLTTYMC